MLSGKYMEKGKIIMHKTVALFGYHTMGCIGLRALRAHGYHIKAVFTHADAPHEQIWFENLAREASLANIPVFSVDDINDKKWMSILQKMNPDFIFSFYFRQLLPPQLLTIAESGAFNLHGSLLPQYRGRCPINWVLINGEKETGVTLHHMEPKADAGDIVGQKKIPITHEDTALSLYGKAHRAAEELLDEVLPLVREQKAPRMPQDTTRATYFGRRTPEDGIIDWHKTNHEIYNLVRALTLPYPGAFAYYGETKFFIWNAQDISQDISSDKKPGTILNTHPLDIQTGNGIIRIQTGQIEGSTIVSGQQLASQLGLTKGSRLSIAHKHLIHKKIHRILILGVNGFIGNALTERLLNGRFLNKTDNNTEYEIYGIDIASSKLDNIKDHPRFHFLEGDISINKEWIEYHIRKCDSVIPLVAIATPINYIRDPLGVFQLDFLENLRIIQDCVKHHKRLIFPSTSEVYGMNEQDEFFDEDTSILVTGPIEKERWIYSASKQLLDRVIWAYGKHKGLQFTIFRPFNWIGPKLDSLHAAKIGSSRVVTQFALNFLEGTPLKLVDHGQQRRCFTALSDGIECLVSIIENKNNICDNQIFNIGNPNNEASIRELAETMITLFEKHPLKHLFPPGAGTHSVSSDDYYGKSYQDVSYRKPSIKKAQRLLSWEPRVSFHDAVKETLDFFLHEAYEKYIKTQPQ